MLTIGSLFAGVGGLEYGLEASGLGRVIWQVEQDQFCRTILAKHWPNADRSVTDVESAGLLSLPRVDVICGGSPCPDFSTAGEGKGIEGERGQLIFAYERAVQALRPCAVVYENVASGSPRWLPHVRLFLQVAGYRTRAIQVAAADVGAPQKRDRIFVIGLAHSHRGRAQQPQGHLSQSGGRTINGGQAMVAGKAAAESDLGRVAYGLPAGLDLPVRWPAGQGAFQYEWEPPRTIPKGSDPNRRARLKALGNAVVPHCGYVAGRALLEWMSEVQP